MSYLHIGIDFGTHQTKVCVETKDGTHTSYAFHRFGPGFCLPSVVQVNGDGTLSYGHVDGTRCRLGHKFRPQPQGGQPSDAKDWCRRMNRAQPIHRMVFRYFKQDVFSGQPDRYTIPSRHLAIWYLSYVLFLLQEAYGTDFSVSIGVPTGSAHWQRRHHMGVQLLLSAYRLVEDVYQGQKSQFLAATVDELTSVTQLRPFSQDLKDEYGLQAFPEARAALTSLTSRRHISHGMNLMEDIGGGTTDISLFTVSDQARPLLYDYDSIPYGLNFVIEEACPGMLHGHTVQPQLSALPHDDVQRACHTYHSHLLDSVNRLVHRQYRNFRQTGFEQSALTNAMLTRPLIYSGGGSTHQPLRIRLDVFGDVRLMDVKAWQGLDIEAAATLTEMCPILATALGLAVSGDQADSDDNIHLPTSGDLFGNIRRVADEPTWSRRPDGYESASSIY